MRFVLVLLLFSCAYGWGEIGHSIVAHIAENFLTEIAREHTKSILNYLNNQNEIDKTLFFLSNTTTYKSINHLSDISSFADIYKRKTVEEIKQKFPTLNPQNLLFQSSTTKTVYSLFNSTYNLHFQSETINNPNELEQICKEQKIPSSFPCVTNSITKAIKYYSKQLRKANNKYSASFALQFLVHFIGDIHQPFHCSFSDDSGGNKAWVYYPKEKNCLNVHYLWDHSLVISIVGEDWKKFANQLIDKAEIYLLKTSVDKEDIDEWWNESFSYLKEYEMRNGKHTSLPYSLFNSSNNLCSLPPFYKENNYGAVG